MSVQARSLNFKFVLLYLTMVLYGANANSNTVQITLHQNSPCENDFKCFTLPSCLLNATACFTSNTTVLFPPGDLNTGQVEEFVVVRGIKNIHLLGSVTNTNVHCLNEVGLAFFDVTNLSITRIQLHNCGRLLPMDLLPSVLGIGTTLEKVHMGWTDDNIYNTIPNTTIATSLFLGKVFNTQISYLVVNGSRGFGLSCFNIFGESKISNSKFVNSNINYDPSNCSEHSCVGGNVFLAFEDNPRNYRGLVFELTVTNTHVSHGFNVESLALHSNHHSDVEFTPSGGLTIMVLHQLSYILRVTVNNSTIDSNSSPQGANCALLVQDHPGNYFRISISQTYISNGNTKRIGYFFGPVKAGGLYISYVLDDIESSILEGHKNVISISNSTVSGNFAFYGAALQIFFLGSDTTGKTKVRFLIKDSTITNNSASNSVVLISGFIASVHHKQNQEVVFFRTTIMNNRPKLWSTDYNPLENFNTTVHIQNPPSICALLNSTIKNNLMQGIRIDNVRRLDFYLDNYVSGNTGTNGGGIQLYRSRIALRDSARLFIENNNAIKGGGLHYEESQVDLRGCFFQTTFFLYEFQIISKTTLQCLLETPYMGI